MKTPDDMEAGLEEKQESGAIVVTKPQRFPLW